MLSALLYCLLAGSFIAALGILYDRVNRRGIDPVAFNLFGALFLIPPVLAGIDWRGLSMPGAFGGGHAAALFVTMALSGVFMCVGVIVLIQAMKRGSPEFAWTLSQCSMVLPFLLGIACFGNSVRWNNYLGLVCVAAGIVLLGRRRGGSGERSGSARRSGWFGAAVAAFAFIGLSQFFFSVPSYWPDWSDAARIRIPIQAAFGLLAVFCWKGRCFFRRWEPQTTLFAAVFALLTYGGRAALYAALDRLAEIGLAPVGYPLCQSLGILGVAAYLGGVRRELDRSAWAFLPPIVIGLFLLSWISK